MAGEKSTKRKRKSGTSKGSAPKSSTEGSFLRQLSDARYEQRYEPQATPIAIATWLGFALGAVALGGGVYAQWVRQWMGKADIGPHPWALYFLIAGAALLVVVALFGQSGGRPVRVGDGGVAIERDESTIERIAWCDVSRLLITDTAVTLQGEGLTISLPRANHGLAAARVVREARERIPNQVDGDATVEPPAGATEPAKEPLDPPQIAGRACKSSGKTISFEKDARLCGRCGQLYHKTTVPDRCLTCDASLT